MTGTTAPAPGSTLLRRVETALAPDGGATGRQSLAAAVVAAVLVPALLVLLCVLLVPVTGAWFLGLVAGLVLDLLAGTLALGVVSHRLTMRKLREQQRAIRSVELRTRAVEERAAHVEDALYPDGARRPVTASLATPQDLAAATRSLGDRLQATQNLFALVSPHGPVPPLVGFVASPDVLLLLVQKFLTLRPSLTLECGSGTSTLFLALAAQQHGVDGRIVSLESDLEYAEGTRALLAEHGVAHLAEVRHAPLAPTGLPDHDAPWYDRAALEDLHDIGLAFVDGPPGRTGPQARYPFVPLLAERLAPRCVIVMDDANRREERGVTERWLPQLTGFSHRFLELARGAGLFERGL